MLGNSEIPYDILVYILEFLNPRDLVNVAQINSEFYQLTNQDYLWKSICQSISINKNKHARSWKESFRFAQEWKWGETSKLVSLSVEVQPNRLDCKRRGAIGANPSAKTEMPFSYERNLFEVTVKSPGSWISVGVSSSNFNVDTGFYLGSGAFTETIECAYYSDAFQSDLLLNGCKRKDCTKIQINDVLSIYVEIDSFHFFRNGELVGTIKPTDQTFNNFRFDRNSNPGCNLLLMNLFPTVSFGTSTEVVISHNYSKEDLMCSIPSKRPRIASGSQH